MPRARPTSQGKAVAASSWEGSDGSFDDEQEDQSSAVQSGVFRQYLELCDEFGPEDEDKDAIFAAGLARVAEYLSTSRDASTCLVCLGVIKPAAATWQCEASCHAILHLTCLQEWARSQMDACVLRATSTAAAERAPLSVEQAKAAAEWGCPKCRHAYASRDLPTRYTCFCGKQQDPAWDPWLPPHTCGELCGKRVSSGACDHTCTLLCHPGPCPPCPRVVTAACHCTKLRLRQRCGQQHFSCGEPCGRKLGCGHACPQPCHEGPCPPCQQVAVHPCACGAASAELPCCRQQWHCAKACAQPLACGRHTCPLVCHAGPCPPCPHAGARTCPCGKASYPGLACDQTAAPCGGTCGKPLACGAHSCMERCHAGECPKVCRDLMLKTCRCGKTQKEVPCHQEVLCERRCSGTRGCGRHPCKRRCCDGSCPPCEEVCHRKLRCGNHRCPAPCHPGPCRPCPLTSRVSCACGSTGYTLVCGAEASAVPPRCPRPCPVPVLCRHAPATRPHRCHFGPCPPCLAACGGAQPCGHACGSSSCHDRRAPPVDDWQQPKPPKTAEQAAAAPGRKAAARGAGRQEDGHPALAAAAAAAQELLGTTGAAATQQQKPPPTWTPCPPCEVPVALTCVGGHQQRTFPCHAARPFSCQQPCGQPLGCGHHSCSRPCHALAPGAGGGGSGPPPASASAEERCEACERPCSQPRGCDHPCELRCHRGPCPPCAVPQSCLCHCSKTRLQFPCQQYQQVVQQAAGGADGAAAADPLRCSKPCHRELPGCRHPCKEPCHKGPCPPPQRCLEEVTVRCECRRLKAKWPCHQVADALAAGGGGSRAYDGTVAQKLLPCDADCQAAAGAKAKPAAAAAGGRAGGGQGQAGTAHDAAQQQQQQQQQAADAAGPAKPSAKKLSRAEREALAAARTEEQLAAERRHKRLQLMRRVAGPAAAALAVLALVAAAFWLMDLLDARARSVWGRGGPQHAAAEL